MSDLPPGWQHVNPKGWLVDRNAPRLGVRPARSETHECGLRAGGVAMLTGALTLFTSEEPAELAKVFTLQPDGALHKGTAGYMTTGRYEERTFSNAQDLVGILASVTTAQAISNSTPAEGFAAEWPCGIAQTAGQPCRCNRQNQRVFSVFVQARRES